MNRRPMDCAEIRDAMLAGSVPSGADVDAHARDCAGCAELLRDQGTLARAFSKGEEPSLGSTPLWASLEEAIAAERGPRAWLRSRATPFRLSVAVAVAAIIVGIGGRPRAGGPVPDASVTWLIAFSLAGVVSLWFLIAPLGRPSPPVGARLGLVGATLVFPLGHALTAMAPSGSTNGSGFAAQAFACFSYGSFLALPFLVVLWALERSDRPWLSVLMGLGGVAGLVANTALGLHCANTEPAHLAAGHAAIGAALALLGALVAVYRTRLA